MDNNQSAVFATRAIAPYHDGNFYYTQSKNGKTINIFHLDEKINYQAPSTLSFIIPGNFKPKSLKVLGISSKIQWKESGNSIEINLPKEKNQLKYSTVIQITE
jgi:alpha-L-fucosidase